MSKRMPNRYTERSNRSRRRPVRQRSSAFEEAVEVVNVPIHRSPMSRPATASRSPKVLRTHRDLSGEERWWSPALVDEGNDLLRHPEAMRDDETEREEDASRASRALSASKASKAPRMDHSKASETGMELDGPSSEDSWNEDETRPTFRVLCTSNNTHVVLRWLDPQREGYCQMSKSTGSCGFKGTKRGTPYAAEQVALALARDALASKRRPVKRVHVLLDGNGRGRSVVTKGIIQGGLRIATISDVTGVPHGGCRPKKARRV